MRNITMNSTVSDRTLRHENETTEHPSRPTSSQDYKFRRLLYIRHPMYKLESWRDIIRGFNPIWFTSTMGTGIVGILLYEFPYHAAPLQYIAWGIEFFNLLLFSVFSVLLLWRIIQYRDLQNILLHPQQSLGLSAIPMGMCTLIISLVTMLEPYKLDWIPTLTLALWIVDAVMSVLCFFLILFIITSHQRGHTMEQLTAAILLPAVPTIVAATGGSVVATAHSGGVATAIILASYMFWGMGLAIATMLLVIYLTRLVLYKLPPKEVIPSVFITIGPLGQSSYGIQLLGVQALRLFPDELSQIPRLGEVLHGMGFILGLFIWSLASWWLCHGIYSMICLRCRGHLPFNLGWWATIFPIGTFASSTTALWMLTDLNFFRVLAAILIAGLTLLWVLVLAVTLHHSWSGELLKPIATSTHNLQDVSTSSLGSTSNEVEELV